MLVEAAGLGHETVTKQLLDLRLIKALRRRILYCRLAPRRPKSSRKMLIGR
jgi:hypothetical protein